MLIVDVTGTHQGTPIVSFWCKPGDVDNTAHAKLVANMDALMAKQDLSWTAEENPNLLNWPLLGGPQGCINKAI